MELTAQVTSPTGKIYTVDGFFDGVADRGRRRKRRENRLTGCRAVVGLVPTLAQEGRMPPPFRKIVSDPLNQPDE